MDLMVLINLKILTGTKQQAINLFYGEMEGNRLTVLGACICQAASIQTADAFTGVAGQRISLAGQAEFHFGFQSIIRVIANLLRKLLKLPVVPLAEIIKAEVTGELIAIIHGCEVAAIGAAKLPPFGGKGIFLSSDRTGREYIFQSLRHFLAVIVDIRTGLQPLEFVVIQTLLHALADFLYRQLLQLLGSK